jgi:predicted dehydrogenase
MKTVGIVGCGNISGIYFENLCTVFENVRVKSCADLDPERVQAKVTKYPGVKVSTLEAMLADPDIDIILNLTTPQGHYGVAKQALEAGKSVHNEKPLTLSRDEGRELLELAEKHGVLVGGAPDTFLGAGIQTCLRLINEGAIGEPIGAQAFMHGHGHEHWHPDPEFYYQKGGGPMFDMGPYYLTALVALLGPVRRVTGSARISFPTRTISSEKKRGQTIDVEVPTHIAGVLDFVGGAVGTISTSFDVWASDVPRIEIFGSEGTLGVPDPNGFGGPIRIRKGRAEAWEDVAVSGAYAVNSRGIAVADIAAALEEGRSNRANGKLAYHVLDIMHGIHDASSQERHIHLESTCTRPEALPENLARGQVV